MSLSIFQQLEPLSKKDRIFAALRSAIIKAELEPGSLVVETAVARQFGVGQPLVREALIELEHSGLVRRVPYRGTYVTQLSAADVENMFRLRAELEGVAAEWAGAHASAADIEVLRGLVSAMEESAQLSDLECFYENDLAFHRKIWAIAGNPYLTESLERLVIPLFAFFVMKNPRVRDTYEECVRAYRDIVDALGSDDPHAVRCLTRRALMRFKDEWAPASEPSPPYR